MDLDCSYDLSWSALPSRPEWENTQQKDLRVLMIEQWMEDLDEAFKVTEEKFNSCHRRQFLTTLLYAIWNDWNQKQSILSITAMHSHNLETQDLRTLKVLSKAHCFPAHLDFDSKKGCIKPGVAQTTHERR